jgi:hypothetical protein
MTRRIKSFIWGGVAALALIIVGIIAVTSANNSTNIFIYIGAGVLAFTLVSCLILRNNFLGDMMLEIFNWGFVRMPGLIFELDLDGIIWFLTVKLLFWILGIALAILFGILAIALGLVISLFVYPFALYKNLKYGEAAE